MTELPIRFKLYAHSTDGKRTDEVYRTQSGFEDANREMLEGLYSLPDVDAFKLIVDAGIGETDVDGSEPFIYSRQCDEQDKRLGKAITYAMEDLKNPASSLHKNLYCQYADESKDEKENFIEFGLKLIDAILKDGGTGSGGKDINDSPKIVAKIYEPYANRYLDYGDYLNYFSFYLEEGMLEDELESMDPMAGDYMMESDMHDFDKEYVLSHIIPALYYSFCFLNRIDERVRSIYDYSLELG